MGGWASASIKPVYKSTRRRATKGHATTGSRNPQAGRKQAPASIRDDSAGRSLLTSLGAIPKQTPNQVISQGSGPITALRGVSFDRAILEKERPGPIEMRRYGLWPRCRRVTAASRSGLGADGDNARAPSWETAAETAMFKRQGLRSPVCRGERGRGMRGVCLTGNAARRPLVHSSFLSEIDWLGSGKSVCGMCVCVCVCGCGSGCEIRASERANERAEAGEEDKTRQVWVWQYDPRDVSWREAVMVCLGRSR